MKWPVKGADHTIPNGFFLFPIYSDRFGTPLCSFSITLLLRN